MKEKIRNNIQFTVLLLVLLRARVEYSNLFDSAKYLYASEKDVLFPSHEIIDVIRILNPSIMSNGNGKTSYICNIRGSVQ